MNRYRYLGGDKSNRIYCSQCNNGFDCECKSLIDLAMGPAAIFRGITTETANKITEIRKLINWEKRYE